MRKILKKLLPVLLIVLLLAECGDWLDSESTPASYVQDSQITIDGITPYSEMVYRRPELEEMQQILDDVCALSEGKDAEAILDGVFRFYDAYDWFYTCYSLADIRYSSNLKDSYWEAENNFCTASSSQVDQMLDTLYYTLAESPCVKKLERAFFGRGFFDSYTGESMWDENLVSLMERESELISQYYTLSGQIDNPIASFVHSGRRKTVQTLVDLILTRREIAQYTGYDNYIDFANDYYYYRDYESAEMDAYLDAIQRELVPLYCKVWDQSIDLPDTTEAQTWQFIRNAAENMGGKIRDAFRLMEAAGLHDLGYSSNKYNSSFEVYLDTYQEPFVFMNPQRTTYDRLTFAHEFGHFCNDYASGGTQAGIDVCEFFSQGMEYLSLFYGEDTASLARAKMVDSLGTYVEQACYARFEREMYQIPAESLSVETLCDLYQKTAVAFGFDVIGYEPDEFITITHLYTNPMYIPSYIVSNDAAMQIYHMERTNSGAGLQCLTRNLDTDEVYFLAFLQNAGLESPFTPGRMEAVRKDFEAVLAA